MADWQIKIEIGNEIQRRESGELSPRDFAKIMLEKLKSVSDRVKSLDEKFKRNGVLFDKFDYYLCELESLIDEWNEHSNDDYQMISRYDYVMSDIYDIADTNLDPSLSFFHAKKLLFINPFCTS